VVRPEKNDRRDGDADGWSRAVALLLGAVGVSQLIAWANRWYVVDQFARMTGTDEVVPRDVYERMATVHTTLLAAVVLLLLAFVVARAGARRAHRSSTPQTPGSDAGGR